jgi:glycosyltransferase involved in cell wall biosynthesis
MKILQISYHYPPMGGAGVQRALKFSKYFPEFGIQPVVLAAHEPGYVSDPSLVEELPPTLLIERIEHTPMLTRLRNRLEPVRANHAAQSNDSASRSMGWKRSLRDFALRAYASSQFPDDKSGWSQRAFKRACELVRDEKVDLILATAPPYSALALAAQVAAATGRPWVADYRDLWIVNANYAGPAWRRWLDRRTETAWLNKANGVVAVTPDMQRVLQARVPQSCAVAMIPNGYDEADFVGKEPAEKPRSVYRIVHTGTFYGQRSPEDFLNALEIVFNRESAMAQRIRLRFVGAIGGRFAAALDAFEARWPGVLERTGFVMHAQAVTELLAADLLLLVIGSGTEARGVLTGKLFEYLRARKPVLLLGPDDGDAANLLRCYAVGAIAPADDPLAMAVQLERFLSGEIDTAAPAKKSPECFERRALTGQLAGFLNQCLESSRERP